MRILGLAGAEQHHIRLKDLSVIPTARAVELDRHTFLVE